MLQVISICEDKLHTVWKFEDFSTTQILCEINVGKFEASKTDNSIGTEF